VTYRELVRKLGKLGCELERQAAGSQEVWIRPANERRTTIPSWGSVTSGLERSRKFCDLGIARRTRSAIPNPQLKEVTPFDAR
jgi:hypothetical protein